MICLRGYPLLVRGKTCYSEGRPFTCLRKTCYLLREDPLFVWGKTCYYLSQVRPVVWGKTDIYSCITCSCITCVDRKDKYSRKTLRYQCCFDTERIPKHTVIRRKFHSQSCVWCCASQQAEACFRVQANMETLTWAHLCENFAGRSVRSNSVMILGGCLGPWVGSRVGFAFCIILWPLEIFLLCFVT